MMNDDDRRRAAQAVLEIPFFHQLWDDLEKAAVNGCINADFTDHEKRQGHAAEARAIRRIRDRLNSIASEQPSPSRRAPA